MQPEHAHDGESSGMIGAFAEARMSRLSVCVFSSFVCLFGANLSFAADDCSDITAKTPMPLDVASGRASEYSRAGNESGAANCEIKVFQFSTYPFIKAQAAWIVGTAYLTGVGLPRNEQQGILWYRNAVRNELNQADMALHAPGAARSRLSVFSLFNHKAYTTGLAFQWGDTPHPASNVYNTTNERGEITGTYMHPGLNVNSKPLPRKEYVYAYMLYNVAAANGYDAAADQRNALSLYMTTNQVSRAQELSTLLMNDSDSDETIAAVIARLPPMESAENSRMLQMASAALQRASASLEPGAYDEAFSLYKSAAEAGVAEAQNQMATFLHVGQGAEQNTTESLKWCQKAAEQGLPVAQYNLGRAYSTGDGRAQDNAEALRWLKKAAERGFGEAQAELGRIFYFGQGGPKDITAAYKWWLLAARQGIARAQQNVASLYFSGEAVERDFVQAYIWFSLTARQDEAVTRAKQDCASKMSSDQIRIAESMVQNWKPKVGIIPGTPIKTAQRSSPTESEASH